MVMKKPQEARSVRRTSNAPSMIASDRFMVPREGDFACQLLHLNWFLFGFSCRDPRKGNTVTYSYYFTFLYCVIFPQGITNKETMNKTRQRYNTEKKRKIFTCCGSATKNYTVPFLRRKNAESLYGTSQQQKTSVLFLHRSFKFFDLQPLRRLGQLPAQKCQYTCAKILRLCDLETFKFTRLTHI